MSAAITMDHVWKSFRRGESATTLRDVVAGLFTPGKRTHAGPTDEFWALKDVSFSLGSGESLGVIGPNGAGKSTLLRVLSRVLRPNRGQARTVGRLSALIEVSAGFHPELTGRENIFLQGAILGMTRREVIQRFDAIVAFSGVEAFLDTPVKRYSSGMYVRLGFAVAAHIQPDVLLVDEVLAVGDIGFQRKCLERIAELREAGTTIIFITHNLELVGRLCRRTLYLNRGCVVFDGATPEATAMFQRDMLDAHGPSAPSQRTEGAVPESRLTLHNVRLLNAAGDDSREFSMGSSLRIAMDYECHDPIERPFFGVGIFTTDGVHCVGGGSAWDGFSIPRVQGRGRVTVAFSDLCLTPGLYVAEVSAWDPDVLVPFDYHQKAYPFLVTAQTETRGLVYLPRIWQHEESPS